MLPLCRISRLVPLLAAGVLFFLTRLPCGAVTVVSFGAGETPVTSLAVVDGRPAVAWVEWEEHTVKYARALDANGAAWGVPVAVINQPLLAMRLTLRVVNGRPAICALGNDGPYFIRALDAAGAAWPQQPVTVPSGVAQAVVMDVINGAPAVLMKSSGEIWYQRALNADGTSWAFPVSVAPGTGPGAQSRLDLKEVQGRPAAVFNHELISGVTSLKFVRGLDADGTAWGPQVTLPGSAVQANSSVQRVDAPLQVVDGRPAVAAVSSDGSFSVVQYWRALTPDGSSWDEGEFVFGTGDLPSTPQVEVSLAVVDGAPAMAIHSPAFGSPGHQLLYTRALDSAGAEWPEPDVIHSTSVFQSRPSLAEVNGRPAVSYTDVLNHSVQYLRADGGADPANALWPPEMQVILNGGIIDFRASLFFNNTTVGSMDVLLLTVRNPGRVAADLHISSLTFTGEHAGEFKILTPPQSILPAGGESPMLVAYAPSSPGVKSSTLEIVSNASNAGAANVFAIEFTGRTLPDISVERPGGRVVPDGRLLGLPGTPAGLHADYAFLVRNTGFADLERLNVEFSGDHRAEFSVLQLLPVRVPAGKTAALMIRHTPLTPGPKKATLAIASNAPDTHGIYSILLELHSGTVDETFTPGQEGFSCVALEPGGRVIGGTPGSVAAFLPDGTPDLTWFAPPLGSQVLCLAVQRDGGILASGLFPRGDGTHDGLVRLLPDGARDPSFKGNIDFRVSCLAVLPDGKILAAGDHVFDPPESPTLVRLLPDGSPDAAFHSTLINQVFGFTIMPEGRVLVSGNNTNGTWSLRLLNDSGSEEPFNSGLTSPVYAVVRRPDGWFAGTSKDWGILLFERDSNVAPVYGATMRSGPVGDLALQADGACLAASAPGPGPAERETMGRMTASGANDDNFFTFTDGLIRRIVQQEDGRPVIAGGFNLLNNDVVLPGGLVRLNSEPSVSVLSRTGSTALRWMRGGTAPEVSDVSFEMNTPGGNDDDNAWVMLGFGTRIAGGWELTGLNLPDTCRIRARGRAGGSLTQAVASYPAPLEAWRLAHFNTITNTGDTANDADPDKDGLTNFAEFAFGLDPANRTSNALPAFTLTNGGFTATFTAPAGRDADVIYRAAWSPSMAEGTWTPVPDLGLSPNHAFHAPATGERVFVRWEVSLR